MGWCGWPDGRALIADCELVEVATAEESALTIAAILGSSTAPADGTDRRQHVQRLYGKEHAAAGLERAIATGVARAAQACARDGLCDRALEHVDWNAAELLGEYQIPASLHGGLERYLKQHIRPGSFLCAILSNDLAESFLRASSYEHGAAIAPLVRFLTYEAPAPAWGSREKLEAWVARKD